MKKYRFDEKTIEKLLEKQWWNGDEDEIKRVKEYEFRVGKYVGWGDRRKDSNHDTRN